MFFQQWFTVDMIDDLMIVISILENSSLWCFSVVFTVEAGISAINFPNFYLNNAEFFNINFSRENMWKASYTANFSAMHQ